MLTFEDILELKTLFKNNQNIIQHIKTHTHLNTAEAILYSYDLQAGSYIKDLADQALQIHKNEVGLKIATLLSELSISSVCEAGIGEATTLGHILPYIELKNKGGFDISLNRLGYAKNFLQSKKQKADLFCAELSRIPLADNSMECIYTFHSMEPNGGNEKLLLHELLRVTKNYLILIEPDYDLFTEEQKIRMDQHGYCKHLNQHLIELGAKIIHQEPWELDSCETNKASMLIIEKNNIIGDPTPLSFVSPISYQPLSRTDDGFFCAEDGYVFPTIKNIPVLLRQSGVLMSHYNHFA